MVKRRCPKSKLWHNKAVYGYFESPESKENCGCVWNVNLFWETRRMKFLSLSAFAQSNLPFLPEHCNTFSWKKTFHMKFKLTYCSVWRFDQASYEFLRRKRNTLESISLGALFICRWLGHPKVTNFLKTDLGKLLSAADVSFIGLL